MILQALCRAYDNRIAAGQDIAVLGWQDVAITGRIVLDGKGQFICLEDAREVKQDRKGRDIFVPAKRRLPCELGRRTSGILPRFLVDTSQYQLGLLVKKDIMQSTDRFQAEAELCHKVLDGLSCPEAQALTAFFDNWPCDMAALTDDDIAVLRLGGYLTFFFDASGLYADEIPEIRDAWTSYYMNLICRGKQIRCSVTGQTDVLELTHGSIKNVPGASPGASLISCKADSDAFQSYGLSGNQNNAIGKIAAFKYTTMLNYLLTTPGLSVKMDDIIVTGWSESSEDAYSALLADCMDVNQTITTDAVVGILHELAKGHKTDFNNTCLNPDERFYVLGLSANGGRIAVEFFYENSFGNLMTNIERHYDAIRWLPDISGKSEYPSVYRLVRATLPQNSKETPRKALISGMMRSILTGVPYPVELFYGVMNRIWAESGQKREDTRYFIDQAKCAALKAYLLRLQNNKTFKEVLTVSLQENSKSVAYNLGRLFAVYEAVQRKAVHPKTTIRQRYWNAAMSSPTSVFGVLSSLSQKHLDSLDSEGLRQWYERRIDAIRENIDQDSLPRTQNSAQQAAFALGYSHEKTALYKSKAADNQDETEDNENVGD